MASVSQSEHAEIQAAERLEKIAKNLILLVGGVLAATFGIMEMKNAPFNRITEAFDPFALVTVGLFIFIAGWMTGAGDDTEIQRKIIVQECRKAKFDPSESLGIIGFFLVFFLLLYFRKELVVFQVILLAFIILNVWTYSKILQRVDEDSRISEARWLDPKDRDYFRYMQLYCALGYLHGSWQAKRFKTLIALAALQVIVALVTYTDVYRPYVPNVPLWSLNLHVWIEYLPAILFLIYVLISEIWMKVYRYKIKSDFVTIDRMRDHFSLQKKKNVDLPPLDRSPVFAEKHDDNPNYVSPSLIDMIKWG